jgi:hypothetical protein
MSDNPEVKKVEALAAEQGEAFDPTYNPEGADLPPTEFPEDEFPDPPQTTTGSVPDQAGEV